MSSGRITRANRRYPTAQRRAARYGRTRFGRRGNTLPPHLMRGLPGRAEKKGPITITRFLFIAGAIAIAAGISFVFLTIVSGIAGAYGTVRAYREVNKTLPNAAAISARTFQTTRIYDRNGTLLQEVDNPDTGWRTYVSYDQISQYLIDATVAAEDATFWTNEGVEPIAILRGGFINLSGAGSSGGSTITQQLVRAVYPDQISALDRSYTRKIREAMAAVALAKAYSKRDIMTMYLNQIYYGARSYGIEAASQTYFNKHAADLTLAEASLLAGLPQSPSWYEPTNDERFAIAKRRQEYVLNQMVKYRYITRDEADAAWNEPLHPQNERTGAVLNAPHFTQYVRDFIIDKYGEDALYSGLQITTSIDLPLQQEAEDIVASGVANMAQNNRNNGAMVVMVPWSGEVIAMVGSADFDNALIDGQVNYATSLIQPGSSIKPLVYAACFEKGWSPATVILDVPTTWEVEGQEPYTPNNYSGLSYGAVSVRKALANSFNIPAVKATEFVTVQGAMDAVRKMGLKNSLQEDAGFYGLSFGLGAAEVMMIEHVNAYATLANNGTNVPVNPIKRIEDSQGNVLFELNEDEIARQATQAIPSGNAYQVTTILTDNKARATVFTENNLFGNTQTDLGRPTAAKSGTTEDWKDLWTMGYTTDVAIGVWVGRSGDSGSTVLSEIDGIQAAGPIWRDMMTTIHGNEDYAKLLVGPDGKAVAKEFPVPSDVSKQKLSAINGHKPTSGSTTEDWVVKGQEPSLSATQLSEYERKELDDALEAIRTGKGRWAGDAQNSIYEYARLAGDTTVPDATVEAANDDENADSSSESTGETSGSGETSGGDNVRDTGNDDTPSDDQIIEPSDQ